MCVESHTFGSLECSHTYLLGDVCITLILERVDLKYLSLQVRHFPHTFDAEYKFNTLFSVVLRVLVCALHCYEIASNFMMVYVG